MLVRRVIRGCFVLAMVSRAAAGDAPDATSLSEAVDAAVQRHSLGTFWGGVLVTRGGETVIARGYGLANEQLVPITADSLFDIGSNAKAFTAVAILVLENEGRLRRDDPVSKFFPEAGDRARVVTLQHLLTHTSGLSDRGALQPLDFADRDEAVRLAFAAWPLADPGAQFAYSNAGYVVLAAVVEQVTGRSYETFVRERLFEPAGMRSTGFLDGVGIDLEHATARVVSRGPGGPARARGILDDGWGWGLRGAGGILTTMNDLVRWHRALFGDVIVDAETRARLFRAAQSGYALGWRVERTAGGRKIHHGGGTRGYRSQIALYPEEDVQIVVLTNTRWDPVAVEQIVARVIWPEAFAAMAATLRLEGLTLDRHGVANLEGGAAWRVDAVDAGVALVLTAGPAGAEAARVVMPVAAAHRLAADIEGVVGGQAVSGDGRGTSIVLGTMAYTPADDGSIRLPDSVEWLVMPRYRGLGSDGNEFVDERTTIVLTDADARFWPIIIKMEPAEAGRLAQSLTRERAEAP